MSNPVSNVEIEDVLSSIRRLVSEDVTPKPSEDHSGTSEKESGNSNVKLVLTPDFRIVEGTPAQKETESNKPEIENQTSDAIPSESEGGENSIEDIRHETLESRIAELESTLGEQPGNWEPDGSGFSEDLDAEQMIGGQAQDWVDEIAQETATAEQEFEEARESKHAKFQPDFELDKDHVYTAAPDAPLNDGDGYTSEIDDTEQNTDFLENEAFIDEGILREMVSEIVRKELQGALGERITRNVRKLVRREINRVLSNQDFE